MRVLVIDDSRTLRSLLKMHLSRVPEREVLFAENGQDALKALREGMSPDLILLDINMPVMNGLEFLKLREQSGVSTSIPVILVTTEGKEEDVERGVAAGARGYLKKPFTAQDLERAIAKALGAA
jgi:two-component system chemotaxis response regulator CheY